MAKEHFETTKPHINFPTAGSIAARFAQRRTYSLAQLIDGRILDFDRQDRSPVYLMTLPRASDAKYFPARSGSVEIRGGFVTNVTPDAASTSGLINGAVRPSVSFGGGILGKVGSVIKYVDLKSGDLLMIRDQQAFILDIVPARDGAYAAAGVGIVEVHRGTMLLKSSKPGGGIDPPPRGGGGGGVQITFPASFGMAVSRLLCLSLSGARSPI